MEIYYYCSYTGSPVGFQLGKLTYDGQNNGTLTLERTNARTGIQRCFDQRAVRKVYWHLWDKKEHFFLLILLKGLTAKGKGPEDPAEYYINFAVTANQRDDFWKCFRGEGRGVSDERIAEAVRDTMQVDRESEFGFKICGDKIPNLLKLPYDAQFGDIGHGKEEDNHKPMRTGCFLELLSPNINPEQVLQALKCNESASWRNMPGNWIELTAKNRQNRPGIHSRSLVSIDIPIRRNTRRKK